MVLFTDETWFENEIGEFQIDKTFSDVHKSFIHIKSGRW